MDFMQGLQNARAGFEMGQLVRQQIDARRNARALDRLLNKIGENVPTQQQYTELMQRMGPDAAKEIMGFQEAVQGLEAGERAATREDYMMKMDFAGNMISTLMQVPEEQRMDVAGQILQPMMQDQGAIEMAKPFLNAVKEGDFSDDNLNTLATMAYGFGRFQEVTANSRAAAEQKAQLEDEQAHDRQMQQADQAFEAEQSAADRSMQVEELRRTNPTTEERRQSAAAMQEQYGGDMQSWFVFLSPNPERMLEESYDEQGNTIYKSKGSNKALNLGTFTTVDKNDPLFFLDMDN